ncbi:MAG: efflux RND transporter periplasmic adaptor subunit [Bacteroidetes bacterium]|nr:efflux RND transporter periplasmic adaptor subunit [Bacteroidota bacterium]MBS1631984.1 efflux RND transporter periplasmic adaptor subunit [Bacteroidota bacterium]
MKNIFLIISIAVVIVNCGNKKGIEPQHEAQPEENIATLTADQYKNAGIVTGKMERQNISSVLKLNGKIDVPPQSMISVSTPLGGYLKTTQLLPGTHVNKGEVLAIMEDPLYIQLQQDYLTAKAQFEYNESEYNRQKELNQSKATSDKVYEQAKATYQTQYILIRSLEQKLKLIGINPDKITADNISRSINIYSPINGFVSDVKVNIGKYVNPSDVLFELVNPDDIHLTLTVFEKDITKLAIGQRLFAYTNTHPEKRYECEIILVSKNIANDNATEVHCHFEQYDKTLLPGMFMNADVELTKNITNALPEEAFVRFENKQYVFAALENSRFEMIEVQAGNSENGFTEIINADKFNDRSFVIRGAYNLLMMLKNTGEEE